MALRRHHVTRTLALLLLLATLPIGCGSGGGGGKQNRPSLIGSFPAQGQVLPGGLSIIRLDFDEPVSILNGDGAAISADGIPIPIDAFQRAGEPNTVYIRPETRTAFIPGRTHVVIVVPGLVINADDHYTFENQGFSFVLGDAAPLPAGAPQAVRLFDRTSFALLGTVATPNAATDTVVGLLATQSNAGTRTWVQRSDPGSGTHNFAYFDTVGGGMTEVPLTFSAVASSHVATDAAIALGPDGEFIYVAYQELPLERVRLAKVDVATATEVASLVLSPIADAGTRPGAMILSAGRSQLVIPCAEGLTGRMCFVDLDTFTESDRDTTLVGSQGVALPYPPRGISIQFDRYLTTALDASGTANTQHVLFGSNSAPQVVTTAMGTGGLVLGTLDRLIALQTTTGYDMAQGLIGYSAFVGFGAPSAMTISDDLGGVGQNTTSIIAALRYTDINRFLFVHDGGLLTQWVWNTVNVIQEDLDDLSDGIQGFAGGANWADIVTIGQTIGQFPP